ncbi:MAG: 4-hydroxy-tetrahydrodipicolinate synthase [Pseudomonadota bacterium]|nr:4-hydroxy-tetrahydrodipicolinate synthase [Pseudomonadota bacterium]
MSKLTGVFTAIVTPFKKGEIDYLSFKKLLRFQLDNNIDGIVVNGTTGESPTLTKEERERLLSFALSESSNQVPVIMGTGTNNTQTSIVQTQAAQSLGAKAALVVVPYYNKPPQEGLLRHFTEIAKSTSLPIILYNVPSRTVTSIKAETVATLSETSNIVGIKEASGEMKLTKDILSKSKKGFFALSGDDATYLEHYLSGGKGTISVMSNMSPKQTKSWGEQINENPEKTKSEFQTYKSLVENLFSESNPIPIKMALYWMGVIESPELRLPLVELSVENQKKLKATMKERGFL